MPKILNLLKQKKYAYALIGALILVLGIFFLLKNNKAEEELLVVSHGDFVNQVAVSGKVVPTEEVELGLSKSGIIKQVYYSVDQSKSKVASVKRGSAIVKIDPKEAEKDVRDAEVNLESAKLALAKLKLNNSEENMNADLVKAYDDGFTAISDAFSDLSSTIVGLEDILDGDAVSDTKTRASGTTAQDYRQASEKLYYEASNAFKESRKNFRLLTRNSSKEEIEKMIDSTYDTAKIFSNAVKSLKNLVDYLSDDLEDSSTYAPLKQDLSQYATTVNSDLNKLISVQTDIKNAKDAFPTTNLEIKDAELEVKQREIALQEARNNLADYYIRAPFDGVITKIDAKVGEIAGANTPLVSMMSSGAFQIESFVPEVSISLVRVGDEARITLDAYGENIFFNGRVVSIDPAETVRDGVSTYKIKLEFNEGDERIKSGMTANVSILIFNKPNVIVLPGGVVFEKNAKKYVQVKEGKKVNDREVVLGSVSSLGQVEVVSGLTDGEMVVLNPSN